MLFCWFVSLPILNLYGNSLISKGNFKDLVPITVHQKEIINFSFDLHQSLLFQGLLDHFFSYLMLCILVTFLGHKLQHELPQTQGLLVYLNTKNFNMPKPRITCLSIPFIISEILAD